MSNERKPLFSDQEIFDRFSDDGVLNGHEFAVRAYYEALIDSGKLRVVEEVRNCNSAIHYFTCSGCGSTMANPYYSYPPHNSEHGGRIAFCPGCGSKIKQ